MRHPTAVARRRGRAPRGAAHEASLYEALEPGADVEGFMSFLRDDLGGGTEALQATEGTVEVVDKDTYETLATYAFVM